MTFQDQHVLVNGVANTAEDVLENIELQSQAKHLEL